MTEIGSRVGAILSESNGIVKFIGFGIYAGDDVPPYWKRPTLQEFQSEFPEMTDETFTKRLHEAEELPYCPWLNPKIILDDGSILWGCEMWWGDEEQMKQHLKGKTIEHVRIIRDQSGKLIGTLPVD